MINFFKIFLSSMLIFSCTFTAATFSNLTQYTYSLPSGALYKNVDRNFLDYKADVNKACAYANNFHFSEVGSVFNWSEYASSWEEFKTNYGDLNLSINMNIAFNWYNIEWRSNNLIIPLNNILVGGTEWVEIFTVDHKTTQRTRGDATHGKLLYDCYVWGNVIKIHFKLQTWASNNYDNYYYSINTSHVTCKANFDYNTIKSILSQKVDNHTLNLKSDYSTSLQDERNTLNLKTKVDELIAEVLGNYYKIWKQHISYTYSDFTNQVTVIVKFTDPNNYQNIQWNFKVNIKYTLSQNFWDKSFKERLTINSGKVINPNNPNDEMINDKPLQWNGKSVYGTTALVRFTAAPDGSETMKVNGVPVQVIDNTFTYQMTDNQEHETNEYDILLEKHDLNNFSKILGSYEVKYLIKQDVPNLTLKWYAWNPEKNPDQKKLIEPTLADGTVNLAYDKEVNAKTGTKTQIVWVKQKAQKPFPLDPLNKNGDIIDDGIYDQGFLAEGSVSGMGITQTFNDSWIKSIQRVKVDDKSLQPTGSFETIKSDDKGQYFSKPGTYLYSITDQKNITANKLIIIGQEWQNKYAKFLDVLNNSSTAVPFWSTLQGLHLKNYLMKYKQLNSKDIQELIFEQVVSYWKEYISDVNSQRVGSDINSGNEFNLINVTLENFKMNKSRIEDIKNELLYGDYGIVTQLNEYDLEYQIDYQINDLDQKVLQLLNGYNSNGDVTVEFSITALYTSTKAIGTSKGFQVRNSRDYDSDKAIDLSKLKFDSQYFNFSKFTNEQLRTWILKHIDQTFTFYNIIIFYQTDYRVAPLDEETLQYFINTKQITKLEIIIASELSSNKTKNSTKLFLTNDFNADDAPLNPPIPRPTPIAPDNDNWVAKKENLIMMSIIIVLGSGSTATIVFFKYRLKKGIGGKKNIQKKTKETKKSNLK